MSVTFYGHRYDRHPVRPGQGSRPIATKSQKVVIVGAGIGGLAAALELAAAGARVTLCEATDRVGGKAECRKVGGRAVASGPTVLTMPWVFDGLFAHAGGDTAAWVDVEPLERLARHSWPGGAGLDLYADPARSRDAIGAFAGTADAVNFARFMGRAEGIYRTLRDSFLTASKPGPLTLCRRAGWRRTLAINPFVTLSGALSREFHDPRLRQLFGRYATYCGASPFAAPATLMLVAYVEQAGVRAVRGGLPRLAHALAAAATRLGANLRCNSPVREITLRGGRVDGVILADGERLAADAVIANCDASAFASGRLGPAVRAAAKAVKPRARSLSALTWTAVGRSRGAALDYHNVFFSADYRREFDDILVRRRLPSEPTVYVCAQDRSTPHGPQDGAERLFCLINAPADGDRHALTSEDVHAAFGSLQATLERCGSGLTLDHSCATTPADYHARYPGSGGALYGRASHGWRATFARPGNRSAVPGLYLAGGSVHPGPGVPMAALSGIQAARCLWNDQTSPSR
ncbi:MAG: phytoene desaturase family protein [Pseudomonadales bacterium]